MQSDQKDEVKKAAHAPANPDERKELSEEELAAIAAGRALNNRESVPFRFQK